MSLGIATYPTDADTKPRLTVCSDEALYKLNIMDEIRLYGGLILNPNIRKLFDVSGASIQIVTQI